MLRTRTASVLAAAALVLGVAAGAGAYAAFGDDGAKTTTVVRQAAGAASPAAATTTRSVNDVYKLSSRGVVEITTNSNGDDNPSPMPFPFGRRSERAQGSGFVYDSAGHIVTNYHVVAGAQSISVTFWDGSKYRANVVGTDRSSDLAVVKVDAPAGKLHPLTIGDSAKLEVGDGVVAIGSPFGLEETVTTGIVSALDRNISATDRYSITGAIQTDAAINHGNSGGPLLNLAGEVIGVTTQIESESGGNDGVGFAIPSNTVKAVASRLASGEKVVHPYLGVMVGDAPNGNGARLGTVKAKSPAAAAGLEAGDVITSFGGDTIDDADALTTAVAATKPGDKVKVTYVRAGNTRTAEVTIGTRPS